MSQMFKKAVAIALCAMMLVSCVPAMGEEAQVERHYIEPTWVENQNGPTIGYTVKGVVEVDGKYSKDSNGNGELDPYENWELSDEERAKDLVTRMTID